MDQFFTPMARTVNRNLLKHAAGQQMFCPLCDNVLDWKRTVTITAGAATKVLCGHCYDIALVPALKPGLLERCEVVDGRVLSKRAK